MSVGDGKGLPSAAWLDTLELDLGDWSLTPATLLGIAREVVSARLGSVVELGSGASTAALAALGRDFGHPTSVVSFDQDASWLSRTRELLRVVGGCEVRLVHAPLATDPGWPSPWYDQDLVLAAAPDRIDLLLVDGPVGSADLPVRAPALDVLGDRLAPGGCIVLDDAGRPEESAIVQRWTAPGQPAAEFTIEPLDRGRAVLLRPPARKPG